MGSSKRRDRPVADGADLALVGGDVGRESNRKSSARSVLELCVLFALPQAVCRLNLIIMNWPRSCSETILIVAQGLLEDATIALQLVVIALIFQKVLHRRALFLGFSFVALLATVPPVVDLSVQLCGFARITRVEIEATVHHWRHMTSSMVDRALSLDAYLYFFAFSVVLYATSWKTYCIRTDAPVVRRPLILSCAIGAAFIGNVALTLRALLPRALAYIAGSLMFTLEFGQAPVSANLLHRWPLAHVDLRTVLDSTELYNQTRRTDVHYPFWRQTWAYQGAKRFDLDLRADRPPNILLVNMESWSHEFTGPASSKHNGGGESLTPWFDRFASEGVRFESHFNPGLSTTNTLFSELFGLKPRFSYNPPFGRMGESFPVRGLPHVLHDRGYDCKLISGTTLAWHNWRTFLRRNRFADMLDDRSMKEMQDEIGFRIPAGSEAWGIPDEFSFQVLERVIRNATQTVRPYFISFYSISSHDPFRIPDGAPERGLDTFSTGTKLDHAYMRAIRYSDRQLGSAISRLRTAGLLSNTIVMVTGDHGRIMGDGSWSRLDYRQFLTDPYSHVPFAIVPSPDLLPNRYRGLKVDQLSSHVDILATVADMLRLPPYSDSRQLRLFLIVIGRFWQHGIGASLMRYQDPDRKLIVDQPQPGRELVTVLVRDLKLVFDAERGECWMYNRTTVRTETPGAESPRSCWAPQYAYVAHDAQAWARRISTWTSIGYRTGRFHP